MIETNNPANLSSPPPIGNTTPNSGSFTSVTATTQVVINYNSAPAPALPTTNAFQVVGGDGVTTSMLIDTIATPAFLIGRRANGTLLSPTALSTNDIIMNQSPQGWNGASYNTQVSMRYFAASSWSTSSMPTYWTVSTTPLGSTTITEGLRVQPAGGVTGASGYGIPIGGAVGLGLMVSNTPNFGVFFGSGVPQLGAAVSSLYLRSDGSSTNTRCYIATSTASSSGSWASLTASS